MEKRERISIPELDKMLGVEMPVLDKGFVRLIEYMGNDNLIASSARISYGVNEKAQKNKRLLRFLMRHQHWSPFEMAEICFHLKLPNFVAVQVLRHRTGNFNQISARYTEIKEECYVPTEGNVRGPSSYNKQVGDVPLNKEKSDKFVKMAEDVEGFCFSKYHEAMDLGVAREVSRSFLPSSFYTQLYYKTDLRNLFNFLKLRTSPGAQYEIRAYAEVMKSIVEKWVPICWNAFNEYHIGASTFSKSESNILANLIDTSAAEDFLSQDFSEEECDDLNLSKREVDELKNTIKRVLDSRSSKK